MHWLHHNVTLSVRCCCCTQVVMFWNNSALPLLNTPTIYTANLLQLDFFHQHFHLCAHMARLKQTEFICFKPGFGKFFCLVQNVSCYDLNRLCLVFSSPKFLRLNPDSEAFMSQLPAGTITILSISLRLSNIHPPHPVQGPHSKDQGLF